MALGALSGLSALGAALHIGGSVLIVTGQTIVKVGHCIEDSSSIGNCWLLPKQSPPPLWRRPDGRWRRQLTGSKSYAAAGWTLFGIGNAMRFVSMRFAAQTVLSGLGSLQFVLIPVASRVLLGIRSHLSTVLGVGVTLLGNVLIIAYGPPEVSFSLRQLRQQWGTTAMKVFLIVLGGLLAGLQCVWWYINGQLQRQVAARHGDGSSSPSQQQFLLSRSRSPSPPATDRSSGSSSGAAGGGGGLIAAEGGSKLGPGGGAAAGGSGRGGEDAAQVFVGALLFSAVASFIGAWSVLFSKSLTYVVTALPASLADWYSWFVIAAFLGSAAFWVRQSDRGLRLYPASLIMPLMQAFWMCMSVIEGGIYFDELVILPANSLLLLMVGLVLALVGAVFMGISGYMSEKGDAALALSSRLLQPGGSGSFPAGPGVEEERQFLLSKAAVALPKAVAAALQAASPSKQLVKHSPAPSACFDGSAMAWDVDGLPESRWGRQEGLSMPVHRGAAAAAAAAAAGGFDGGGAAAAAELGLTQPAALSKPHQQLPGEQPVSRLGAAAAAPRQVHVLTAGPPSGGEEGMVLLSGSGHAARQQTAAGLGVSPHHPLAQAGGGSGIMQRVRQAFQRPSGWGLD